MITTMPVFISSLFTLSFRTVDADAKSAIETARQAFADAETEMNFGDLAKGLISKHTGASSENLTEIACWHYERSVKQFRLAMGKFQIASRHDLPSKYSKYVESKKSKCVERANTAFAKLEQAR
ncbi:MAG: hypothetical protein ABL984_04180 [Pyrinomonadaceae bacterium]